MVRQRTVGQQTVGQRTVGQGRLVKETIGLTTLQL